jgi:hypothetical protein
MKKRSPFLNLMAIVTIAMTLFYFVLIIMGYPIP